MSLSECENKSKVIETYRLHDKDTGSPEVQIAILTKRLEKLSDHFAKHPQDKHSRRGLLRIVSRRKRLLSFLKGEDVNRYKETLTKFGLRK